MLSLDDASTTQAGVRICALNLTNRRPLPPAPMGRPKTGGGRGCLHLRPPPEPGHAGRERAAPSRGRRGQYSVANGRRQRQGGPAWGGLLGVFQPPTAGFAGHRGQPRQGDHLADKLAPGEQEARGRRGPRAAVQGQRRGREFAANEAQANNPTPS